MRLLDGSSSKRRINICRSSGSFCKESTQMKNNINYMLVTYSDFAVLYYSCNYTYSFSFIMHFTMNMSLPPFSHNTHTHVKKNTTFEAHRYVLKQQRFNNNERTGHGEKIKCFRVLRRTIN